MEFLDEDARPRFRPISSNSKPMTNSSDEDPDNANIKHSKLFLFFTISLSSTLIVLSLVFLSDPAKSILLWFSLSLLIGPFAPSSITGGDPRVGGGPAVSYPAADESVSAPEPQRRSKPHRRSEHSATPVAVVETLAPIARERDEAEEAEEAWEEKEWREDEIEVLKKQLVKHPVGRAKRWEAIAESFRGRHGVESVIGKAKELGEKRTKDDDSYSEFLRRRKPVDKRLVEDQGSSLAPGLEDDDNGDAAWSSGEDIALLNALKAFPKDVPSRWEKVAMVVPGKSKAACVKRVAELKKGFRSSKKASTED